MVTVSQSNSLKDSQRDTFYLSPLKREDVTESYVAWLNDPEINQYLEVRHNFPILKDDVERFVEKCVLDKRPHWGIFDNGRHIGNVSCSAYDLRSRWIDISFLLGEKEYWGKGIGTDAVASAVDYLLNTQQFHKVRGGTYGGNTASKRVFEKLGFKQEACLREEGLINGKYEDIIKYGILIEEWKATMKDRVFIKVFPLPWSFYSG